MTVGEKVAQMEREIRLLQAVGLDDLSTVREAKKLLSTPLCKLDTDMLLASIDKVHNVYVLVMSADLEGQKWKRKSK